LTRIGPGAEPTAEILGPLRTPTPTIPDSGFPVADSDAPLPVEVVEVQPSLGQELPLRGEIVLTFNQAMDPQSTSAAWQLIGPDGSQVPGQVSWPEPGTLRFQADRPLDMGSAYRAVLGSGAASAEGAAIGEPLEFVFNTVGELQVSQTFPADGAIQVANDAVITAIFNRPVVPLVIAEERDTLINPLRITPTVSGHGEWVSTSVYAFRPDAALRGGDSYTVTIRAGLADAAQETRLTQDVSWRFTTIQPSLQSFELKSLGYDPRDTVRSVLLDESFVLRFFQPMDTASVQAALRLTSQDGAQVALVHTWEEQDTQLTAKPAQRLALGTTYTLDLSAAAQAASGGTLDQGLRWTFTTIPAPAVLFISPPNGPEERQEYRSELVIQFASPMNIASVKEGIVISPAPTEPIQWYYDEYEWNIRAYILEPSTAYQARLLPGLRDIYGNATAREYAVRFTTPAAPPSAGLQMPYQPAVMRLSGPQQFYVTHRNIAHAEVQLSRITPFQFVAFLNGDLSQYDFRVQPSDVIWEQRLVGSGELNERVLEPLTPAMPGGDPLPPGFYFLTLDSPDIPHPYSPYLDTRLLVVASANLTFKTTGSEALIWATDLQSGEPLPGVPITVYNERFRPVAQGVSDADGLLQVAVPLPPEPYDARYAVVDDVGVFGFASSSWGSGVDLYDYGIWGSYYAPGDRPKVYVYTDRPIYRPDQPVYFKGILRHDDDLAYRLPEARQVHVTITNYKETIYEEDLPLSPFGTFDGELSLDPNAVLGSYSIQVLLSGEEDSIGGVGFTVAEYRKPEFQVQVGAAPTDVLSGDQYTVSVAAEYYSGGGVGDALVEWTLSASPFQFAPPNEYSGYSFSDEASDVDFYADFGAGPTEIVAEGRGRTDADGKFVRTVRADLSEFTSSRQFIFEATVTDLSTNAVSGRAAVVGHRSAVYPGVKPRAYVGTQGQQQFFDLAALDWDGQPLSGQSLQVEIAERRWYSVQEQDATGRVRWTTSVEEIPVASLEVTSDSAGQAAASFTPPKGGVYRARVSTLDAQGNRGSASTYLWVAGRDYIPWRQTNDRGFDLIADRAAYAPGDTAEILIASPFQGESYALLTVERGHIYSAEVLRLTTNSTVYRLPITAAMAPNTFVSVVVMKGIDATNPRPDFKLGMVEIKVDTRLQELKVTITPDREQASPGEQVTYRVTASDNLGRPVDAELSLGLSDLATLSLLGPNAPPILDFFYQRRTLAVWTSIPIDLSLEDYNASIEDYLAEGPGMGGGGGKGEGEFGVAAVRQDFPDTPFWEAHLQTGSDGRAEVTVTLPDNLTTWRMDARATTLDTRVGQATQDLISTLPLLVRPQTPRFFVVGDRVTLGAAVHNNTVQPLSVEVRLVSEGLSLESPAAQQVEVPAQRQAYATWVATVNEAATRVNLVFRAEGVAANGARYQDASRPPQGTLENQGLPVYRHEVRETVGTSGQLTSGGTRIEAISLPSGWATSEGSLSIDLAPSLAAGMTDGLTYLEEFPYECVEQTISRFLPNVLSTQALKAAGLSDPDLEANLRRQVSTALQRLANWQNPDGGWGWWADVSQESDVQTSAYAVLGLLEAQQAGYTVSQGVLDRGLEFLQNRVVPIGRLEDPSTLNRQAFVLYVLARGDLPDISATVRLFDQRQNMAFFARAFLADTFYRIDREDPRLQTLLSDFATGAIVSATGTHWEETQIDRFNWNTDTRSTAIVLSALSLIDLGNPINANAVRWLMAHRSGGHWNGTQETAWTLMALTRWMQASGELSADYQYAVALNGERLGGGTADQSSLRRVHHLAVDVADLLQGEANRLAIARDDGPGNLYYTARLDVSVPVTRVPALEQGITISRSYYSYTGDPAELAEADPVTRAQVGDLLLVRLTVVAPSALHYVMIEDPLPAGLEALDQSLEVSPQNLEVPQSYAWEDVFVRGWGWWYFEYTQLRDEKVLLSASYLPAGTYIYTYLARASTPGIFNVIPSTAQEFYFPEVYGRGAGSVFEVRQ
jgi:uncharacterized protein YfaS (alpha-2-macroglobulin family)